MQEQELLLGDVSDCIYEWLMQDGLKAALERAADPDGRDSAKGIVSDRDELWDDPPSEKEPVGLGRESSVAESVGSMAVDEMEEEDKRGPIHSAWREAVGRLVREARLELGMTRERFSDALRLSGTGRVDAWESGSELPSRSILELVRMKIVTSG